MSKIIKATFETYGTASWEFDYDVEGDVKSDDCTWPTFHNGDTEAVSIEFDDGQIIDLRTSQGMDELGLKTGRDPNEVTYELWEKQNDCEDWTETGVAA